MFTNIVIEISESLSLQNKIRVSSREGLDVDFVVICDRKCIIRSI